MVYVISYHITVIWDIYVLPSLEIKSATQAHLRRQEKIISIAQQGESLEIGKKVSLPCTREGQTRNSADCELI